MNARSSECCNLWYIGPDGRGAFSDRSIAIGIRRLSIIDLKGGWQPLFNENKNLAVIANGEIYNYLESLYSNIL